MVGRYQQTNEMLLPANYDIFVERGIKFGPLVITVYSDLPPLTTPDTPTVTPEGTSGATAWGYQIVAKKTSTSQYSAASTEETTATGNATLDDTNYNRIAWTAVTGANRYDIYRTTASGTPATTGLIGTTSNTFFNDTGVAGDASTPPTTGGPGVVVDLTGYIAHAHARRIPDDTVLQNLSPIITDYTGGEITIGKFTDEQTLNFSTIVNGRWSLVLENGAGDWLPPIMAGAYSVVNSVTRNAPLPIPPPDPAPEPDPVLAYLNVTNVFTVLNTFTGVRVGTNSVGVDYTLTTLDFELTVDATAADVNIQLPAATGTGQVYHVKKIDPTANVVYVLVDGTDLIDGSVSVSLLDQYSDCLLLDAAAGYWDNILS